MAVQLLRRHGTTFANNDEGDNLFPPVGMRPPDDGNFIDLWMGEQGLLDLARIDICAAGDDHVLGSVFEGQKARFIETAHIACMQPAATQGFLGRLRVFPVAEHDHITAHHYLADFPDGERLVVGIEHFYLDIGALGTDRGKDLASPRVGFIPDHVHGKPGNGHW